MDQNNFNITNYIKIFQDNTNIFLEGTKGREMYVILKGEVEISRLINEERQILSKLKPGDFFGEMSTVRGSPRVATATAIGQVECVTVTPDIFKHMLQQRPGFGIKIIKELCNRLEDANERFEKMLLLNQTERVVVLLSNIATNYGTTPFKQMKIKYDSAIKEIAEKTQTDELAVEKTIDTLFRYGKLELVDEDDNRYISVTEQLLTHL